MTLNNFSTEPENKAVALNALVRRNSTDMIRYTNAIIV